jgi:glucose/arabinose dehydrogenase
MRYFALITISGFLLFSYSTKQALSSVEEIHLPPEFKIDVFASDLGTPRFMAFSPDGVLFATIIDQGKVVALPDKNKDGKADRVITFIKGLDHPHGIAFYKGYLYIGETDEIVRFKYNGFNSPPGKKKVIVPNLPTGGHFTRTVGFGPDGKMYVSIGSSCNICEEKDERRAAILQFNPDGSGERIFAKGLRNAVGFTWRPGTEEMWATDNGRDWLGDDLPPEEIDIIKEGNNYGWPYCYGDRVPDPKYNKADFCKSTTPPVFQMQAHSAPLGLTFYGIWGTCLTNRQDMDAVTSWPRRPYPPLRRIRGSDQRGRELGNRTGKLFPKEYWGDLFVAFHGSWNRSIPTGYKVVRIKMKDGKPEGIEDFATGWLQDQRAWGKPVDVVVGPDGGLYVSDDVGGFIYRITPK